MTDLVPVPGSPCICVLQPTGVSPLAAVAPVAVVGSLSMIQSFKAVLLLLPLPPTARSFPMHLALARPASPAARLDVAVLTTTFVAPFAPFAPSVPLAPFVPLAPGRPLAPSAPGRPC